MRRTDQDRLEFIRHTTPGQHIGVFWEDEDDRLFILVSAVEDGLRRGNFIFVLTSEPEKLSSRLRAEGITPERHKNLRISDSGQLFRSGAGFDADGLMSLVKDTVNEAVGKGYAVVTSIGDYAHLLSPQQIRSLVNLEERVGTNAPDERMTAFCFFRAAEMGRDELFRLMKSHGYGIFPGIAMPLS